MDAYNQTSLPNNETEWWRMERSIEWYNIELLPSRDELTKSEAIRASFTRDLATSLAQGRVPEFPCVPEDIPLAADNVPICAHAKCRIRKDHPMTAGQEWSVVISRRHASLADDRDYLRRRGWS